MHILASIHTSKLATIKITLNWERHDTILAPYKMTLWSPERLVWLEIIKKKEAKAARREIVPGSRFGLFSYFRSNQPLGTPKGHFVWRDNRTVPLPAKGNLVPRSSQPSKRTSGKIRFDDVAMCQECDLLRAHVFVHGLLSCKMANRGTFEAALKYALCKRGMAESFLKSKQRAVLEALVRDKRELLVILPTGYGKWLIYQLLPDMFNVICGKVNSAVLVVSPAVHCYNERAKRATENY